MIIDASALLAIEPGEADTVVYSRAIAGRSVHSAGLNFGDCLVYGVAKAEREPLLFKGADFAKTDIEPALKD